MRHPDIAPYNCRTSQGATRQLRTLRLSHITPCNIALSHPATFAYRTVRCKKAAFYPLNPLFPTPSRRSARSAAASQNPTSAPLSACGVRLGQRASCPLRCEWKSGKVEEWNGGKVERLGTTPLLHHSLPHQWGTLRRFLDPNKSMSIVHLANFNHHINSSPRRIRPVFSPRRQDPTWCATIRAKGL